MAKAKAPPAAVEVRIISTCSLGAVDAVVALPADEVAHWKAAGAVDDSPAAVAYAKSQQGRP